MTHFGSVLPLVPQMTAPFWVALCLILLLSSVWGLFPLYWFPLSRASCWTSVWQQKSSAESGREGGKWVHGKELPLGAWKCTPWCWCTFYQVRFTFSRSFWKTFPPGDLGGSSSHIDMPKQLQTVCIVPLPNRFLILFCPNCQSSKSRESS